MNTRHSDLKRKMVLFALMVLVVALVASTAFAHTGLGTSSPADGETVSGPLKNVSLSFTGTPTAQADSVAVADDAGITILPVSVVQTGNDVVATFDPPLIAGSYVLAWRVRSDDTHFVDGAFAFNIAVPVASTTTVLEAGATPPETMPETTAVNAAPSTVATALSAASDDPTAGAVTEIDLYGSAPVLGAAADDAESVTRIGRLLIYPAAVTAIGMLVFAGFAFAGRREELGTLIRAVRWLGVAVLFGGVLELVGLSSLLGGLNEVVGDSTGRAVLARLLGGGLLVIGFAAITEVSAAPRAQSLSSAVVVQPKVDVAVGGPESARARWLPTGSDSFGLIGAALIIVSFAFDGHTVSQGPRLLHALTSVLHVAGAAAWAGGLVALAVVLWRRHQDGVRSFALEMVLRFSVLAMAALALTGLAGVVMALFIDSNVLGYAETDWGRLMILKLVLVAAAALLGAYNHFRVLPELITEPANQVVIATTRRTVTIEAVLVLAAAAATALLVAASTL
ncbi:MAG: copper resistance protein CopC [Ilumatobacter sp.]|nr:copper resistance protein CopC [Ilumatobacter sp.]